MYVFFVLCLGLLGGGCLLLRCGLLRRGLGCCFRHTARLGLSYNLWLIDNSRGSRRGLTRLSSVCLGLGGSLLGGGSLLCRLSSSLLNSSLLGCGGLGGSRLLGTWQLAHITLKSTESTQQNATYLGSGFGSSLLLGELHGARGA